MVDSCCVLIARSCAVDALRPSEDYPGAYSRDYSRLDGGQHRRATRGHRSCRSLAIGFDVQLAIEVTGLPAAALLKALDDPNAMASSRSSADRKVDPNRRERAVRRPWGACRRGPRPRRRDPAAGPTGRPQGIAEQRPGPWRCWASSPPSGPRRCRTAVERALAGGAARLWQRRPSGQLEHDGRAGARDSTSALPLPGRPIPDAVSVCRHAAAKPAPSGLATPG